MLPTRWSHLVRHGLLGTTLLGLGAPAARADRCDDISDSSVTLVLGLEVSPRVRLIGGIEGRRCLTSQTEAMVRLELGGGARLIGGVRARPFEKTYDKGEEEHIGFEAGGILDFHKRLGIHLAATYGIHAAYAAVQANLPLSEPAQPARYAIVGGLSPWTLANGGGVVVEGRPIVHAGRVVRPGFAAPLPAARSAEERAARDHFASSAQLEYSSVWTFLRLAAELAAVGAPAHLIVAALDAAEDEVRHAELCARAAGGATLAPLPAALARRGSPRARRPRSRSSRPRRGARAASTRPLPPRRRRAGAGEADGPVAAMLAAIARDEAGHAELSWAVLAWLFEIDPAATAATLAALPPPPPSVPRRRRPIARWSAAACRAPPRPRTRAPTPTPSRAPGSPRSRRDPRRRGRRGRVP